jgi:hypothetical protein
MTGWEVEEEEDQAGQRLHLQQPMTSADKI